MKKEVRDFDPERTMLRLGDIRNQARFIAEIVALGADSFAAPDFNGELLRAAATKSIETIAEATAKLHPAYRACFPQVPWRDIYRMRTKTVHHYDETDDEVWDTMADTGGAITNEKRAVRVKIPGTTTPHVKLEITGPVHEVTNADPRWVTAKVA